MSKDKTIPNKIKDSKFYLALKRIGAYITASFIDFKRSPLTIFFTVAYPVILILLFGAIFSESNISSATYTLYYQSGGDEGFYTSPTEFLNMTDNLINILDSLKRNDSTPLFNLIHIPHQDESSNIIDPGTYLEEVEGNIALIIPKNFTQQVIFNPPVNLTIILDENSGSAGIVLEIVNSIVYSLNYQTAGYNETKIGMDTTNIYLEEGIDYFDFLIPGIIGIAIMNNGIIGTINRYTYFDKKGFFRKLSSSPMKKNQVVIGEATWVLLQGFISIIVILLIGYLVFKVGKGDYMWIINVLDWKIIPITIATVLTFTGFGMIAARIVKNPSAATAVGNFLAFPMMFLSGAFFEVAHIPALNIISKMLPLTYIINALRSSMITPNIALAWINIGISFAFGIVIFTIGILVTKLSER
ncbi:MAG TPA: ABC transporter permease [Candidatus Bathyarchaeia archaeon]|nr:ABC transporter permease [Candidatus Bathyarchaeia archaeon]